MDSFSTEKQAYKYILESVAEAKRQREFKQELSHRAVDSLPNRTSGHLPLSLPLEEFRKELQQILNLCRSKI